MNTCNAKISFLWFRNGIIALNLCLSLPQSVYRSIRETIDTDGDEWNFVLPKAAFYREKRDPIQLIIIAIVVIIDIVMAIDVIARRTLLWLLGGYYYDNQSYFHLWKFRVLFQ